MLENVATLEDLVTALQTINTKDYGDFKRKVVLYMNRYAESTGLNTQKKNVLEQILNKVQFYPNFDIEKTRHWILQETKKLQ